jgi:hypothetical protein
MTTATQTTGTPEAFFKDRKITKKWVNTCLARVLNTKGARLWWNLEMSRLGNRSPNTAWNDDKPGDREKVVGIAENMLDSP